jgi:methyl halide transferase
VLTSCLTGELVTLIFPVEKELESHALNVEQGPPFEVNTWLYRRLLEPVGFRAAYLEPAADAIKPRRGREWLGRWRKGP